MFIRTKTDGQTDTAISSQLLMLIKNLYFLYCQRLLLLHYVTNNFNYYKIIIPFHPILSGTGYKTDASWQLPAAVCRLPSGRWICTFAPRFVTKRSDCRYPSNRNRN